jgi:hypothetical protein
VLSARRLWRALRAAGWALKHADDLTMLKFELERDSAREDTGTGRSCCHLAIAQHHRADTWTRKWLAKRFLGTLPIN